MGDHDSEIMDGGRIDRDDAGAMGVVAAGGEEADTFAICAGTDGSERGLVYRRVAWRGAAQDRMDARGGGGRSWSGAVSGGQQELLGRDRWDADALRDLVRDY